MSVPLLPQSAPFTTAQRAWLNGFFAGLASRADGAAEPSLDAPAVAPPAAPEDDAPWRDAALSIDERLALSEGRALESRLMSAMAQLDCGSCGYECRSYAAALAAGSEADARRCVPGGKETARALKGLLAEARGAAVAPPSAAPAPASAEPDRVLATVREVRALNGPGSGKDTRFVAFDLEGTGLRYEAGDSLGVCAENAPELVDAILAAGRLDGAASVPTAAGQERSLAEALRADLDLAVVEPELVELVAAAASEPTERDALRALATDLDALDRIDLLALLERAPSSRPDPRRLAEALAPLRPRLYSISSSPRAHAGEVHLTVAVVRYELDGRERLGVASTYLAERAAPGSRVPVFVQAGHGFRLPSDPRAAVVMVGPGTGIAPFRAFLAEREARGDGGRSWLFFGDRNEATDFLYRDELEAWRAGGRLTRLDTAFSRDGARKLYVQDRMREHGAELARWLTGGAFFYVCGDAKRMASDVDGALVDVLAEHAGMDAAAARAYVDGMRREGRYLRDVY